jgi:hypothetical protein
MEGRYIPSRYGRASINNNTEEGACLLISAFPEEALSSISFILIITHLPCREEETAYQVTQNLKQIPVLDQEHDRQSAQCLRKFHGRIILHAGVWTGLGPDVDLRCPEMREDL